ncbi:MAG: diguanylate cyclase [Acidimicrobiales bacterium]
MLPDVPERVRETLNPMPPAGSVSGPDDRVSARLHAFELIYRLQAGLPGAADELESLVERAGTCNWDEVVRICLFGRAVRTWMEQAEDLPAALEALLEASFQAGDQLIAAVGLAMRSDLPQTPDEPSFLGAADADLARAAVLIENAEADTLESVTAHTACGIAFANRWLWELCDAQYHAALETRAAESPRTIHLLLAPVLYNRAEVQVSWACMLRQVGDTAAIAERLEIFEGASRTAGRYELPASWSSELDALGLLLRAIGGADVLDETRQWLDGLDQGQSNPRAVGHLRLAVALSAAAAGDAEAAVLAEQAIETIGPHSHPHEYDLALFLAAELEAPAGRGAGLRYATRQLSAHWARRSAALASMQARLAAERLSEAYVVLARHAHLDHLTGIANRRGLDRYLADMGRRNVRNIAWIAMDIDGFKEVNDRLGHLAGDEALVALAGVLQRHVRPVDLAARLGGDEFVLVLAGAEPGVARSRAEQLVEEIGSGGENSRLPGPGLALSVGIAFGELSRHGELAAEADSALYKAKATGGGQIVSSGRWRDYD